MCYTGVIIKKNKKINKSKKAQAFVVVAGGGLLLVALVAQFFLITHLLNRTAHLEDATIKYLITENLRNLTKEAVVEPQTGKVYMYEPKLVLPPYPNDLFSGIRYTYTPPTDGAEEELQITSTAALNQGIAALNTPPAGQGFFDKVPFAQTCSRQAVIMFKPGAEPSFTGYSHKASRPLADGRTLELFMADECTRDADTLAAYLNQLQSY